ncbi:MULTISPECIES: hypothetical protein [unclassified Streptomyces]|uniref:hypothetical protein n=1 Tax=unclassified Streptomyces TaxID=2593676 RepID=UPI003656611E
MPTDEVSQGGSAAQPRIRTGPRHAAPKKPLATRFHMPAGKAIAFAAMPTAVLMGIGFTPTLANADDQPSTSKSLTAEEYQACVELLDGAKDDADASATATPSASASASASESADETEPSPSATASAGAGETPSPDSGSDDEAEPTPSASKTSQSADSDAAKATPTPSASESSSNPLDPLGIGDAIKDILTPDETASATPTPSASASASASAGASEGSGSSGSSGTDASDTVTDKTDKVTETAGDTVKDTTDTASEAAKDAAEAAKDAADDATSSPSPSASATTDAADCPISTDEEGNVDNPAILPDDPWYLDASSLLLKGADYQGIVKVKTANGTVKKVLKYVISGGTDIGDLHQRVVDKNAGKTYNVQAGEGTTSTIRDGDTVMYTESISGKLFGLIPITFDPETPPPLNIPLIYFTDVKVVQAGQFGGTLTIPGMHQSVTD